MTSQLCQNFQASLAVHGDDGITTPHFYRDSGQFSERRGLQVDTLNLLERAGVPNLIQSTLIFQ